MSSYQFEADEGRTVFHCCGLIPLIFATSIVNQFGLRGKATLVLEKPTTWAIGSKIGDDYFDVMEIFLDRSVWKQVLEIKYESLFFSFHNIAFWPKALSIDIRVIMRPFEFRRAISHLAAELSNTRTCYVSDNVKIWKKIYPRSSRLIYIEHGMSSYNKRESKVPTKTKIKNVLSGVFQKDIAGEPECIFFPIFHTEEKLHDEAIRTLPRFSEQAHKQKVQEIFRLVLTRLEKENGVVFDELKKLREAGKGKQIIFYLPTSLVRDDEYREFLRMQLNEQGPEDKLFVIKPHPNDTNRSYRRLFLEMGFECFEFDSNAAKSLPVEFLVHVFKHSKTFGSASSGHFYSYFWHSRVPDITPVTAELVPLIDDEYGGSSKILSKFLSESHRNK